MRVLHFVTGGFSGATQVAVDLCLAGKKIPGTEVMLVLRRKRNTDAQRVQALRDKGLTVHIVSNWLHALTVWELRKLMQEWKPDVVFAHGFSDHIWGRRAAVAAKVPHIFHVEHNARERYTPRRLRQALELSPWTQAHIGVSEGVKERLIELGFPAEKCVAIPNGIDLQKFPASLLPVQWSAREPALLMASRFARQKDHETLINALYVLRQRGIVPQVYLAGSGSARLRQKVQQQVAKLGLSEQVVFLGNVSDLPQRLAHVQICVLSTHWEGMPLALVEGMAAGCACIASHVVGAKEVFRDGVEGMIVPHADAQALAQAIQELLADQARAQALGQAARNRALSSYGLEHMWHQYAQLMLGGADCEGAAKEGVVFY